jgi:hypothetical protein
MSPAVAPRLVVCLEYQRLLHSCQKSLAAWQQHRTLLQRDSFNALRLRDKVARLQEEYGRAYAMLENHEQHCRECQYIAKVGGMDFESMANALDRRRPFS